MMSPKRLKLVSACGATLIALLGLGVTRHENPREFPQTADVIGAAASMSSGDLSRDMRMVAAIALLSDRNVDREVTATDPSLVFLLVSYRDGSVASGSGTIVMGDDGTARVLSASHVSRDGHAIEKIAALADDGEQLALLRPVWAGNGGADPNRLTTSSAAEDLSVLKPLAFASRKKEAEWKGRAVRIAATQPDSLMAVAFGKTSTMGNSGISGGSLRSPENEVIGVMNFVFYPETDETGPPSEYLARAIMRSGLEDDRLRIAPALMRLALGKARSPEGGTGLAVPVTSPEVLRALEVSGVGKVRVRDAFLSRISGFPNNEMRVSDVVVSPLGGYRPDA